MCTAAPPRSVRSWLRTATQDRHARVDAAFAGGLQSLAKYRIYLLGMHELLSATDAGMAMATLDGSWDAWRPQARVALLRGDLAAIGVAPPATGAPVPIATGTAAAGALYVLEGSALGARLLARDVAALDMPADATTFLRDVTGAGAAQRWRRFLERLDAAGVDAAGHGDAATLDAAQATFQRAEDAFARARLQGSAA